MYYLISKHPKHDVGTARPVNTSEMAAIAVEAAGGGLSVSQVAKAMTINREMLAGSCVLMVAGVTHCVIIGGD